MRNILSYGDLLRNWIIDKQLGVETGGLLKLNEHDNIINFMYEPSSYKELDLIFSKWPVQENDHFIDFGCGKGRVLVAAARHGCRNLYGIDISGDLVQIAQRNMEQLHLKSNIKYELLCMDAKKYEFDHRINWIFFYNPFQLKVFIHIFKALLRSLEYKPRKVTICFTEAKKSVIQYFEKLGVFTCIYVDEKKRMYVYKN